MADIEDSRERTRTTKREWMRAWRAANLEKARERNRAWNAANPEKARAMVRRYQTANPAKLRAYRVANRAKTNEQRRERLIVSREEDNAKRRARYAANPDKRAARSANRAKENALKRARYAKRRQEEAEKRALYRSANLTKVAYSRHKSQAKQRGIPFLLTFEEWATLWLESEKWEQRGRRKGQYVMARFGDMGPYEVGNVHICTCQENNTAQARYARARHDRSFL